MFFAEVFGIFTGILGVIKFFEGDLPRQPNQYRANYRIAVGLNGGDGKGLQEAGGQVPIIRIWDENGDFLGAHYHPGHVDSGSFKDVTVRLKKKHQPTYAMFTGRNDAVCIAYISSTWADGSSYAWIGNWADKDACNRSWYYSNIWLDGRKLNCAWVDRNGDKPVTGIQIHFPEFKDAGDTENKGTSHYCAQNPSLVFHYDKDPKTVYSWAKIHKRMLPENDLLVRQGESPASDEDGHIPDPKPVSGSTVAYNVTRLVQSVHVEHSALELCASETSRGPDLVSLHENTFCDMSTRETLPLCQGAAVDCFDLETREIKASNARIQARREPVQKKYTNILKWD
ncbi:hypothetical protein ACHAQA_008291 [Verticillium albo-atrum]